MNEEKISINLLGVCVLRDMFASHDDDGGYQIKKFSNLFAPLYALDPGITVDEEAFLAATKPNFSRRCMLFDVTRQSLNWIASEPSDYLIVDVALLRKDYFVLEGGVHCFRWKRDVYNEMARQKLFPPIVSVKKFNDFSDQELETRIRRYAEKILELYPPEKIILFQISNTMMHYNKKNGTITCFEQEERLKQENIWINKAFEIFGRILKGCHVVYMPEHVVSDTNHKLKEHPMHYTQEYYDYALKAVDIICKGGFSRRDEEYELEKLRRKYSAINAQTYAPSVQNSLMALAKTVRQIDSTKNRLRSYVDFYSKMLQNEQTIQDFCEKHELKRIAIYGWNKISPYIAAEILKGGTAVSCIVENRKEDHISLKQGEATLDIMVLPRNTLTFSDADAILIADIASADIIRKKLQKITSIPVYSAEELHSN